MATVYTARVKKNGVTCRIPVASLREFQDNGWTEQKVIAPVVQKSKKKV